MSAWIIGALLMAELKRMQGKNAWALAWLVTAMVAVVLQLLALR